MKEKGKRGKKKGRARKVYVKDERMEEKKRKKGHIVACLATGEREE